MRAHLPILPVLIPLLGALLSPIVALVHSRGSGVVARGAAGLTAAASLAALADVIAHGSRRYAVGGWAAPWGIEIVVDPLSAFVVAALTAVAAVALVAVAPLVRATYGGAEPAFYTLGLLVITGTAGVVVSGDLFNVFVFMEVSAIASYALVASGGGSALVAGFRYLVVGSAGTSFYLMGVGLLYALTGTLNMGDLATRLRADAGSPLLAGGAIFVLVGLAIKMALYPLHHWLPDAYTHAPTPVSILLAPIGTKAAAYLVARTMLDVIRPDTVPVGTLLGWAGALAVLLGGVQALRQTDARRLLAYSSVGQVGYIAIGLGVGNPAALAGAYLHVLAHAVAKAALFLAVGAAAAAGRGVGVGALGRSMPITGGCAIVAALSMVGVPPSAGFFSKWYLLQGAAQAREPLLVAVVLAGSLLAAAYMYRLTERIWIGSPALPAGGPDAPAAVTGGLLILAVATIVVGLASEPIVARALLPAARP